MTVRRSALALALVAAAALLPASPARAQGRAPVRGAALLGFEDGDGPAGLALRVDGELVQRPLSPTVGFSIVGSLGYTRFSDDGGAYDPFNDIDARWEASLGILKFVPAARFTFGRSPTLRPYADAGLGLYYASSHFEGSQVVTDPFVPPYVFNVPFEVDDSEVGIMLRFAAGLAFEVSPGFSLGAEVGLTPYLGDLGDDTTLSLLLGAQMRL